METKNVNITITVSEETKEMYEIHNELRNLWDKVDGWYEKYHASYDSQEANDRIMEHFYDKSCEAFGKAETLVISLIKDTVESNIMEGKGVL